MGLHHALYVLCAAVRDLDGVFGEQFPKRVGLGEVFVYQAQELFADNRLDSLVVGWVEPSDLSRLVPSYSWGVGSS